MAPATRGLRAGFPEMVRFLSRNEDSPLHEQSGFERLKSAPQANAVWTDSPDAAGPDWMYCPRELVVRWSSGLSEHETWRRLVILAETRIRNSRTSARCREQDQSGSEHPPKFAHATTDWRRTPGSLWIGVWFNSRTNLRRTSDFRSMEGRYPAQAARPAGSCQTKTGPPTCTAGFRATNFRCIADIPDHTVPESPKRALPCFHQWA